MHVILNFESGVPIYEQIEDEIRGQILAGKLKEGELLPSIRQLAKELKVGVITAKRAYDDLCAEKFCYSVQGKGVYVAKSDKCAAQNFVENELRSRLKAVAGFAEKNSVSGNRLVELLKETLGK